ncbi:hypothetical protein HK101_003440 [Irineochytrium annulatum]|nr:hypothetical protein HK101_003440 [Irineochytrium annulatum]
MYQLDSIDQTVAETPILGHLLALYHLSQGDHTRFVESICASTRTSVVIFLGAFPPLFTHNPWRSAWLAAIVGWLAGILSDAIISAITMERYGVVACWCTAASGGAGGERAAAGVDLVVTCATDLGLGIGSGLTVEFLRKMMFDK